MNIDYVRSMRKLAKGLVTALKGRRRCSGAGIRERGRIRVVPDGDANFEATLDIEPCVPRRECVVPGDASRRARVEGRQRARVRRSGAKETGVK